LFIGRLEENRKLKQAESFDVTGVDFTQGRLSETIYADYIRGLQK
jgi:hypothetical protein